MSSRPKKSTLTQQQKNKKRQRATPNQLDVLKAEFRINPTPSARDREEIGRRIDMTERSVQIWFQNKRAKAKIYKRRGQSAGPDLDSPYPALPFAELVDDPAPPAAPYAAAPSYSVSAPSLGISCASLIIGSWRRVSSSQSDLSVVFSPAKNAMLYTMYVDGTGFQIEYAIDSLDDISLTPSDSDPAGSGQLRLRLMGKPAFSVQVPKFPGRWIPCEGFSELRQASLVNEHVIVGPFSALQVQVYQLYSYLPAKLASAVSHGNHLPRSAENSNYLPKLDSGYVKPDHSNYANLADQYPKLDSDSIYLAGKLDSAVSNYLDPLADLESPAPELKAPAPDPKVHDSSSWAKPGVKAGKAQSNPSSPCSRPLLRRRSRSVGGAHDENHSSNFLYITDTGTGLISPHSATDQHAPLDSFEGLTTPSLKHENIQSLTAPSLASFNPILTSPTSPPSLYTKSKPSFTDASLRPELLMTVPAADSYLDDSYDSHFSSFLF